MAFELRPGGDLEADIRRIGAEQIAQAITNLTTTSDRDKGIHEARKCLKRTRALLRFARPALNVRKTAKLERRIGDTARSLSGQRDNKAMLEILERLAAHHGETWCTQFVGSLRGGFEVRIQRGLGSKDDAVDAAAEQLEKTLRRIERLKFNKGEVPLGKGLENTYARARRRFRQAFELGNGAAFHDWRKEAQRHWRQMQLMTAIWPEAMSVRVERARALSQCLGDDHDIHVLLGHVRLDGPELAPWSELESFYDGCIARQLTLRMAARNHGQLLFAERPDAFRHRMVRYWIAARERYGRGAALPARTIEDDTVVAFPAKSEPEGTPPLPTTS